MRRRKTITPVIAAAPSSWAAEGSGTDTAVAELGLWGNTGRTIPDGLYRLVSRKSNKVIDLAAGGTANGTQIVQWTYGEASSQKWTLASLGNGQFRLTSLLSNKVMDVSDASTASNAKLIIQPWSGGNSQRWKFVPAGDGYFRFINTNSTLSADVASGSTADGANLIQWPQNTGDNQLWSIGLAP